MANVPIEEITEKSPKSLKIFQIYLSRLNDYNIDIIKRAKDCGFIAIALTVDTNEYGNRENEVRN
jgi:isopentenyl diphosphate isomerase/L-lactate dehydrogenase-like FMN-dependent dehydrogenase